MVPGAKCAIKSEPFCEGDDPVPDTETEDEPGAGDAFQAATDARCRTHPLWVGLTLAALAGHPFDPKAGPGPVLADWLQEHGWQALATSVRELDATEPVGPAPRVPKPPATRGTNRRTSS